MGSGRCGPQETAGLRAGYCRRTAVTAPPRSQTANGPPGRAVLARTCRDRCASPRVPGLLLLPGAAALVPPAGTGAGDPLLGEDVADLALPFRVAVGDGHFAIHR